MRIFARRGTNKTRGKRLAAVTTAAVILGGGLALAPSANASVGQGYVSGWGTVSDDWGDEGPLSSRHHAHSNATALWQAILWADKMNESYGNPFDYSDIDCSFGRKTTYATKQWQKYMAGFPSSSVDGVVGKATFGKADSFLRNDPYGRANVKYYVGKDGRKVWFYRDGGKYKIRVNKSIGYKVASYTSASACG